EAGGRSGAIQVLESLGQFYRNAMLRRIDLDANGSRKRDQPVAIYFQQSGPAAILPSRNLAEQLTAPPVDNLAAHQVRLEEFARFERRALADRHAHLRSCQSFCVGNGFDT